MAPTYNYFKGIPELPDYAREKTKRPKLIAVVDEDGEWTGTLNEGLELYTGLSVGKGSKFEDGTKAYLHN